MRRFAPLLLVLLVALAFLGTLGFLWNQARETPQTVTTTTPQVRDIVRKTVATGAIVPRSEVGIKPAVSGLVAALHVEPGQLVEQGDLVAEIRVVPDSGRLASAQARVRAAELNLQDGRRELDRTERLAEESAVSQAELDRMRSEYTQREQELDAARTDLQIVRDGASRKSGAVSTEVRAPVRGMVLSVPVEQGWSVIETNTFNEGTTIATVADMGDLIFQGKVDESEVGRISEGMALSIKIAAFPGRTFDGALEYISPKGVLDQGAVQFEIRAAITPPDDVFVRAGSSANADIVLDKRTEVLAIEEAVLQFDGETPYVEVQQAPQQFARRDVALGLSDGIWVQVEDGVAQDDVLKRPEG
ncbi:MAG: efflux RND transporter periplasmic adaptor subunit [Alphaproteobacteria bacterium]|nr:efflux RND transporter periplasmic adaptor subunit [Alphaproteobacteria bacterium]